MKMCKDVGYMEDSGDEGHVGRHRGHGRHGGHVECGETQRTQWIWEACEHCEGHRARGGTWET